ncbi:MAG TPA: SDR family NAD(P)-dependent oxidoreductase, partial [Longimicrobiaceae bacterium]|nr:SDR family NAD(P)-dependent oxidoreductase [Longimicrobiaceae bacterium]
STPPREGPFRLEVTERGTLDNLAFRPVQRRRPGPGEVELRVLHTGLNFRDVLNALGMYPGDPGPLGLECAGVVERVGEGVAHLRPGEAVMALAPASLASHTTIPADFAVPLPAGVGAEGAATVPVTFLTALYALRDLAGLRPGERVLVHAAAGGVGIAAVQLARMMGAEVLATASPPKWDAVRALGVEHVMNSRTLDFSREVLEATGGEGVDVVLNSLAGDFIDASFAALRPGGRFVEIGKTGIWDGERVAALGRGHRYDAFDLVELAHRDPARIQALLRELGAWLEDGTLRPLPVTPFPLARAVDAFRWMAQAKHVGKVVLAAPTGDGAPPLRADATYLVTGGLGSLGIRVARWLADRGAGHLVLVGRGGPSPEAAEAVEAIRATGAEVTLARADVAREDEVRALVEGLDRPLAGVFHAAGVLADGTLAAQRWERFAPVLAPKVAGAWNLHRATEGLPLDHFVLFSSAASLLGSAGQGNYAAANAFLDALAHHRRARALPATSVNWAPWAEAGMAAGLGEARGDRWKGQGMGALSDAQGLASLGEALE